MSDPPLHICLVSDEYPPDTGWGGIGTYAYNLARGLVRAGHRVTVVAGCANVPGTTDEDGITVHRIVFAPPSSLLKGLVYRFFQAWTSNMRYFRRKLEFAHAAFGLIRGMHQKNPIDIIETAEYDANGFFLARWGKIPMVVKIHTPVIVNTRLNRLKVTREVRWCDFLERRQAKKASRLTTPSAKMRDIALEWLSNKRPILVVPNPIDTDEFSPDGPAKEEKPYLFYTGRLERRKGVHILLEAFQRVHRDIPGIRLILAGHDTPTFVRDGNSGYFLDYARATGLLDGIEEKVVFLGKVDRRELPPYYRGSIACVFPSEEFENFPYSCLEAMSCGRAVIVTDSGGMAEMMENGKSGVCVRAGNPDDLATAIKRLASDSHLSAQMGQNARARVLAEYSMEKMTNRTLAVYHEVLNAYKGSQ